MIDGARSGAKRPKDGLEGGPSGQRYSNGRPRDDTALIVGLAALARRIAAEIVGADAAEDIAQDVAMELLEYIDDDGRVNDETVLRSMMRRRVRSRCIDWLRQSRRRRRRELTHAFERRLSGPTWMSPDASLEERELAQVYGRLIDGLPPLQRRTYVMIREERLSYAQVARALGLPRSAVHGHLVVAQVLLRDQLRLMGIVSRRRKARVGRAKSGNRSNDSSRQSDQSKQWHESHPFPTRRAA